MKISDNRKAVTIDSINRGDIFKVKTANDGKVYMKTTGSPVCLNDGTSSTLEGTTEVEVLNAELVIADGDAESAPAVEEPKVEPKAEPKAEPAKKETPKKETKASSAKW